MSRVLLTGSTYGTLPEATSRLRLWPQAVTAGTASYTRLLLTGAIYGASSGAGLLRPALYATARARAGVSTLGFSVIERPQVLLAGEGQFIAWRVISHPSVSFTARTDLRIGFAVISSPTVEFDVTTVAKHGELEIIEKPYVKWTVTIGKSQECVSADGSRGGTVPNAVY